MYEEYADLEGFDPNKMNDPKYVELVKEARQIKDNADEVKRSQSMQGVSNQVAIQETKQEEKKPEPKPIIEDIKPKSNDFLQSDFIEQEKYNANSQISKMLDSDQKSKPINSMWISKGQFKKYISAKSVFKIKEKDIERYRTYRYHAIGDTEIERLRQMAEDLRLFYNLMQVEQTYFEDREGIKKAVLRRNGKYYNQFSKLETDYRKELAKMCLGIDEKEFSELEMFSDPDYTVHDIWGLADILDGILERAVAGSSYFRIASSR